MTLLSLSYIPASVSPFLPSRDGITTGTEASRLTLLASLTYQISLHVSIDCIYRNTSHPEFSRAGKTNLVKVLQEVDNPALNLVLVQTRRSRVQANTLVGKTRSEFSGTSNGGATELEGCRRPDGTRHGGSSQRADNGGTEHGA